MTAIHAVLQAVSLYTAIPLPGLRWDSRADRHLLALFPLAGALLGGIWYGAALLLLWLNFPGLPAAALCAVLPFLLTGFLHLDGFMDVCDAVLSRRDWEKRLEILKDPHTGAFSVLSAITLFLLQFSGMAALLEKPERLWILVPLMVLSRALAALALYLLPTLPTSGMAEWVKRDTTLAHRIAVGIVALAACALLVPGGVPGLAAAGALLGGCVAAVGSAYRQLGGVSGDVAGYALTVAELCGLFALAVV